MAAPPLHLSPCLNPTSPPDPTPAAATPAGFRRTASPSSLRSPAPPGDGGPFIPTMFHITEAARAQGLRLELRTLGPFFRVRGLSLAVAGAELGRAEGVIRPWFGGRVLHLDSMRMSRETLGMDRSIFGLGLFVGAAAVRHGFDRGCRRAELLAIHDTDLYHDKLVRFYTRMGFRAVREVEGSAAGDLPHMLAWGGRGTRMDASVEELLLRWGRRFSPPPG